MIGSDPDHSQRRHVIIHGHFYQPPRENPWLDSIEPQPSAAPYHDWNERIYDECYRPNAYSRLLDPQGMIIDIHNNFSNLSFNFGPTLFAWLVGNHYKTAHRIIDADRESCARFAGHGNALCQVFNHSIMPLASRRDQLTQIRWAKTFFRKHFEREPEGIWLAETAINMETVLCLIEEGIRFVILSPSQAQCIRPMDGSRDFQTAGPAMDTRRPYRIFPMTQSGERLQGHLDVFFFNEQLSREISFGDILSDSYRLGRSLGSCFDNNSRESAAVVIATDGETFGHHKPLSDMCLSYFFCKVAKEMGLTPVNFGYYLELHPPAWEVMLRDNFGEGTAWSCVHGLGRWSRDCGCKTGGQPSWKQEWRGPLRNALQTLQRHIDATFEKELGPLVSDPWKLRDAYQSMCGPRSFDEMKRLMESNGANKTLSVKETLLVRRLLEAQKFILFSFTSCGWFFSDVSGIETIQNIAYAARALELGIGPMDLEMVREEFLTLLDKAKSNVRGITGKTLFEAETVRFRYYKETIGFAAVVKKIFLYDTHQAAMNFDFDNFHVTITNKEISPRKNAVNYSIYSVELDQFGNFDSAEFLILIIFISQTIGAEIIGLVAPAKFARDKNLIESDPHAWLGHSEVVKLDISSVFEETKTLLTRHFLDQLYKDTRQKYEAWMERNEKIISSLCSLDFSIPNYILAPIAFIISDEWNTAINELEIYGREEEVFARLVMLWKKAQKYKINLDFIKSTRLLEQLLFGEMTIFAASLSPMTCDRIELLLKIVDQFKIPVAKNKIEDAFHNIFTGAIRPLYNEFKQNPTLDPQKRKIIIRLLNFARRMNFSIKEFQME
jgi:alpha-amylase/alpha-mannosidase (GH57 family)